MYSMEIIHDINSAEAVTTVATRGSFDGVHRGHVAMIEETKQRAAALGLPVTLVTFANHPRMLFDSVPQPFLLSSPEPSAPVLQLCFQLSLPEPLLFCSQRTDIPQRRKPEQLKKAFFS